MAATVYERENRLAATKYGTWKNGRLLPVELANKLNKQNVVSTSNN